ncbi:insulinase family protein [Kiritimatiellaeota bacterium B1221]|nr:insulinase family protein [Kiritimatiellaeota bacterium B1221]
MNFELPSHPAFTLIEHAYLPMWNSEALVYRHQSGAKVLSLCNDDDHKTFGIVFPTPPTCDTGLPHILEHCVLCGSEKFPVKEPFKEMLKTSLQTFLNAFTYPDRTCYPVSSQNLQDFYNLMDVYLDAVFFPRLTPAVLGQEGWRYQWNEQKQLEFQGVVFNEMKGVYASPDSRLDELVRQGLFPDTPYRFDYGGRPEHIPDLDFETFTRFHRDHYHPANALIGFYGNDDPQARLDRLHEVLERAPENEVPAPLPLQKPWSAPKRLQERYPASEGSDEGVFCQLNWLLAGNQTQAEDLFLTSMATGLLLNSYASPLRMALLESGLGEDIIGGHLNYLQQPAFSAGLKGVEPEDTQAVFDCIISCLEQVVKENFRPDLIAGAINSAEFNMRELNTSNKGLSSILQAVQPWIYGGDPLSALHPETYLNHLKTKLAKNPRIFADWVQENLLDNQARLEITLSPDSELEQIEADREAAKLKKQAGRFDADEHLRRQAEELARAVEDFQNIPDSPEATAKLPKLTLADISPLPTPAPFNTNEMEGVPCSSAEVHSNGIAYLQFAFDFQHLTLEELTLLPLYSRCLTELGTTSLDQRQFNEQLSCHSGGINVSFETTSTYRPNAPLSVMMMKTKCLASKIDHLLDLLTGMFTQPALGPAEKVHQLLLEERSNEEADLVQSGHQVVSLRLKASFSAMERATEEMDGICYLLRLRELEKLDPETLREQILTLHQRLISRAHLTLHVGGDPETLSRLQDRTPAFLGALPEGTYAEPRSWDLLDIKQPEGWVTASPIQFVGLACQPDLSATQNHFSHFVAQRLINNDYLWERVRMKGGAYGSSSSYSHLDGLMIFSSYRDPHVDQTLEIYKGAGEWLQNLHLSKHDLEQAVIGTIGKMSPPERPSSQVSKSFFRHLIGLSFEQREKFWKEILETTPDHLHAYGKAVSEAFQQETRVCVLGGQKALEASVHSLSLTKCM